MNSLNAKCGRSLNLQHAECGREIDHFCCPKENAHQKTSFEETEEKNVINAEGGIRKYQNYRKRKNLKHAECGIREAEKMCDKCGKRKAGTVKIRNAGGGRKCSECGNLDAAQPEQESDENTFLRFQESER